METKADNMTLPITANFNGRNVVTYVQTNLVQQHDQHDNCLTALIFNSLCQKTKQKEYFSV
jgi:hypothetical protein